jgi:hypothetical protein
MFLLIVIIVLSYRHKSNGITFIFNIVFWYDHLSLGIFGKIINNLMIFF